MNLPIAVHEVDTLTVDELFKACEYYEVTPPGVIPPCFEHGIDMAQLERAREIRLARDRLKKAITDILNGLRIYGESD